LSKKGGQHLRLATQALDRKAQFTPQVWEVQAAQIPHFNVLQVLPDPFPRVEVRGIGRELRQVNLPGSPFGQKRAHVPDYGNDSCSIRT
jgi:hypothetical protein